MTYIQHIGDPNSLGPMQEPGSMRRNPLLLIVEDDEGITRVLQPVCDFLDVAVERLPSEMDLAAALRDYRPMGLVAHSDCRGQDGCHIMMTVAGYDRSLPMLLLTGDDPVLAGAAEAVEELWRLEEVMKWPRLLGMAAIIDFLFRAGRKGHCTRFVPV